MSVRIPADVDREDRVLANLTARQLLILTVTGLVLYGTWSLTHTVVPLPVFLVVAIPLAACAAILALGQREGITLDRLLLAAIRQRLSPRHRVAAPEGLHHAPDWLASIATSDDRAPSQVSPAALRLPAEAVSHTGVIDLGAEGLAVVAVASTVNFALRTAGEQQSLVASFGRYLHSLTAPVQILIRAERLDLSAQITHLREQAAALPHPALERAAREHADYLTQLRDSTDLLRRQVLIVLREPLDTTPAQGLRAASPLSALLTRGHRHHAPVDDSSRRAAEIRLARRLTETVDLLAPAGIVVTPLDAGQATAVLAAACNPDSLIPPTPGLAGADDVITTAPAHTADEPDHHTPLFDHAAPEHDQGDVDERVAQFHRRYTK